MSFSLTTPQMERGEKDVTRRMGWKNLKAGDRILDTHLGSGSSAIAAHYGGFDFVGCELDADYYNAAVERFNNATAQIALFGA